MKSFNTRSRSAIPQREYKKPQLLSSKSKSPLKRTPSKDMQAYGNRIREQGLGVKLSIKKSSEKINYRPKESKSFTANNISNEAIKNKLRKIFEFYCMFGERMNVSALKSHKYLKFAMDAGMLDNHLTKTRLELIFASENKSKFKAMNFETFMNSMIKIGEYKYLANLEDRVGVNKYNKASWALQTLLKNHVWPLYEKMFEDEIAMLQRIEKGNFNLNDKNNDSMSLGSSGNIVIRSSIVAVTFTNVDELLQTTNLEELLTIMAPTFYEIYKVYFPWEISLSENENFVRENSMKAYFIFLKDFEVCPPLINKTIAFQLYQSESGYNEMEVKANFLKNIEVNSLGRANFNNPFGKHFTLVKFIRTLCKLGDYITPNQPNNIIAQANANISTNHNTHTIDLDSTSHSSKLSQVDKICLAFEKLELSAGFLTIEQKTSKTHSKKMHHIVPKDYLNKIKAKLKEEEEQNTAGMDQNQIEENKRKNKIRRSIMGNFKDFFEHTTYIMENFGTQLHMIFKFLCSYGDPLNTTYMKSNKFHKFLKEAGLIQQNIPSLEHTSNFGIKLNDIDVIFLKLAGTSGFAQGNNVNQSVIHNNINTSVVIDRSNINITTINTSMGSRRASIANNNPKIDFNGFINSLELISLHIFPNRNEIEAIDFIIKNHVLPMGIKYDIKNNGTHQTIVKEKSNDKDFADALSLLYKTLVPIYRFYMNKSQLLSFDQLFKFASDFSIFPDFVSKSKLNKFFKTTNEGLFTDSSENEYIDQHIFIDILAQCAFEIPYRAPEPSSVEKVIFFVEKISQSKGIDKILKVYGHTRLPNGESFDILHPFKLAYPSYFEVKEIKKLDFFDVLNETAVDPFNNKLEEVPRGNENETEVQSIVILVEENPSESNSNTTSTR